MREEPRFHDSLDPVALPTAIPVARMFIADTLRRWHALFIEDHMEAVAVELVTLAVEATGPSEGTSWSDITELNPIRLRMLGYQRHIVFEVTDAHPEALAWADDVEDSIFVIVTELQRRAEFRITASTKHIRVASDRAMVTRNPADPRSIFSPTRGTVTAEQNRRERPLLEGRSRSRSSQRGGPPEGGTTSVEVPGIEPGSSGGSSGLLRAQSAKSLLGPIGHANKPM